MNWKALLSHGAVDPDKKEESLWPPADQPTSGRGPGGRTSVASGLKETHSVTDSASAGHPTECWFIREGFAWLLEHNYIVPHVSILKTCYTSIDSAFNLKVSQLRLPLSFTKALYMALPKTGEKPVSATPPRLWSILTCTQQQWEAWPHLEKEQSSRWKKGLIAERFWGLCVYEEDGRCSAMILQYADKKWFSCRI